MQKRSKSGGLFLIVVLVIVLLAVMGISLLTFIRGKTVRFTVASEGTLLDSFTVQGVITREETLVKASATGVVRYYYAGGMKLKKNTQLGVLLDPYYGDLLDEKIAAVYAELEEQNAGQEEAFAGIEKEMLSSITDFLRGRRNTSVSELYDLKESLTESQKHRREIFSISANKRVLALLAEAGVYLNEQEAETSRLYLRQSGIIEYSYDGYESWTPEQIGADFIANYNNAYSFLNVELKNREKGEALYRVITSEDWRITLYLTDAQAGFVNGRSELSFYYNEEERMTGEVELLERAAEGWKLVLKLNKSMQAHDTERIATLRFVVREEHGIKISDLCLVSEDLYYVPRAFVTSTGSVRALLVLINGEAETVPVSIVFGDEENSYFRLPEGLSPGMTVMSVRTEEEQTVSQVLTLGDHRQVEGVYTVNGSNEVFRPVTVILRQDGYAIVDGLSLFDRVKLP